MDRNAHSSPSSPTSRDPRSQPDAPKPIHQALEVLKTRHHITDLAAFTMLIERSVATRLTLRDTAIRTVEESR